MSRAASSRPEGLDRLHSRALQVGAGRTAIGGRREDAAGRSGPKRHVRQKQDPASRDPGHGARDPVTDVVECDQRARGRYVVEGAVEPEIGDRTRADVEGGALRIASEAECVVTAPCRKVEHQLSPTRQALPLNVAKQCTAFVSEGKHAGGLSNPDAVRQEEMRADRVDLDLERASAREARILEGACACSRRELERVPLG
jgi:hypothetical protein